MEPGRALVVQVYSCSCVPGSKNFEEFRVGISYQITISWQKHHDEGGRSLCIADGRVDSVSQDLCHGLIVIDRVADGNP
eukprot:1082296-Pelagomonas_calceolata.AAC.1